jgi:CelD/BcsL family acetyltransferase involved in cellulose biosynthesis
MGQEPLASWGALLDTDSQATFLQGPTWAMQWYRAYRDSFDPLVLMTTRGGALVGLVPLAVEKSTGRLAFAGDQMGDYRDVIAAPGCREDVLSALLTLYRDGGYPNMLHVGPTLPESETADILLRICRVHGVKSIRRGHFGWRWWPEEATEDPLKKKSVRYPLNYFRRRGNVDAEVIERREAWEAFRDEFYDQHSLRQLAGGRPLSFDNPTKRVFFDSLFDTELAHVTALQVAGRTVASHYGCLWKNVLYWGAPAFDVRESAYSPGLLLVVLTMKHAAAWGIRGFDLTIGGGDLKERFSTSRVDLPSVDLYARWGPYAMRRLLDFVISRLRRGLILFGSDETLWTKRVRPFFIKGANHARTAAGMGVREGWRYLQDAVLAPLIVRDRRVSFELPEEHRDASTQLPADHVLNRNRIYDLLKFEEPSVRALHYLSRAAAQLPQSNRAGDDLHTLLVRGRIVAWGFSKLAAEAPAPEVENAALEAGTALLHDFQMVSVKDNSMSLALLIRQVAAERMREGAKRIQVLAFNPSGTVEAALRSVGFRVRRVETRTHLFRWEWKRIKQSRNAQT